MTHTRTLAWFRRDLRLTDNTMLTRACAASREVVPVFVFDTSILERLEDKNDRRVTFIHQSLLALDAALRAHGSGLLVRIGDPVELIPRLAADLGADAVFTNRDYEPAAQARDALIETRLRSEGREFHSLKDQVIYERDELLSGAGTPFRVFTPYKKAWLARLEQDAASGHDPVRANRADLSHLLPVEQIAPHAQGWDLDDIGFLVNTNSPAAGEKAAQKTLASFLPLIDRYKEDRDIPARNGTSRLSVHLRFGTISIRMLVREAMNRGTSGADTWLSELIWREFYQMILDRFPHVVDHSFKPEYDAIVWPGREDHFHAWCEGRTGYPIVDAAMRHFNATGWMHNRLRMIVAMFLTKDLLIDWRWGEAYFARHLIDFDLASNNGGWQWSASTGCDAQPYFRIFNPVLQSAKFDPDGTFIRMHCPELSAFDARTIHWPHTADIFMQQQAGCVIGEDYPHPIVHHNKQREKVLALFKNLPGRE